MKGRNNHEVVFNTGCSATTNHYMHMNEYCIAEVEEDGEDVEPGRTIQEFICARTAMTDNDLFI